MKLELSLKVKCIFIKSLVINPTKIQHTDNSDSDYFRLIKIIAISVSFCAHKND